MKRMLVLLSDGFEEIEAMGTVDILRRCGVYVEICSATGSGELVSSRKIHVLADSVLEESEMDVNAWDGVILPGGQPNSDTLRHTPAVVELVRKFYQAGKLCCAICAAPVVLERAGLLVGRRATAYPGCLTQDESCVYTGDAVTEDGLLITGRGPGVTCDFAFTIARALGLKEQATAVYQAMLFK